MSLLLDALSRAQRNKGSDRKSNTELNEDELQKNDDSNSSSVQSVDMEGLELNSEKPKKQEGNSDLSLADEANTSNAEPSSDNAELSLEAVNEQTAAELPLDIEAEVNEESIDFEPPTLAIVSNESEEIGDLAELNLDDSKPNKSTDTEETNESVATTYDSLSLEKMPGESIDIPSSELPELEKIDVTPREETNENKANEEVIANAEAESETLTTTSPTTEHQKAGQQAVESLTPQKLTSEEIDNKSEPIKQKKEQVQSVKSENKASEKPVDQKTSIKNLLERNKKRKFIVSALSATLISLIISVSGFYYYIGQIDNIGKIDDKYAGRSLTPIGAVPPEEASIVEAVETELSNSVAKIKAPHENAIEQTPVAPINLPKKAKIQEPKRVVKKNGVKNAPRKKSPIVKRKRNRSVSKNVVRKKRNKETPVHSLLISAFNAFKVGNDSVAKTKYFKVLDLENNNRDALLGLGAIAVRNKKMDVARNYYTQLLKRNQSDSVARAALVGLVGQLDPIKAETELKLMLKNEPGAGYLHFALGNTYATQQRWLEAQKSFVNAYRTESNNPDYAYNIAVSYDHLGEATQAVKYYKEALLFSEYTKTSFQSDLVKRRIESLVNIAFEENR